MPWYLTVLLVLAVLVLLFAALVYFMFKFAFARPKKQGPLKDPKLVERQKIRAVNNERLFALEPQDMALTTPDGLTLRAWYLPADKPCKRFVLFSHGYTCNGPDEFSHMMPFYHEKLGYNCLYPDHRGHGRSQGKYLCFGTLDRKDLRLWAERLIKDFGEDIEIIIHGISMGAATAMLVNQDNPPAQVKLVIEDCGYSSAFDQISDTLLGMLPVKSLPLARFLTKAANSFCRSIAHFDLKDADCLGGMKSSKVPTLFIHGDADDFVKTSMCSALYDACETEKDIFLVSGAIHAFSYYVAKDEYDAKVESFIDKVIGVKVSAP